MGHESPGHSTGSEAGRLEYLDALRNLSLGGRQRPSARGQDHSEQQRIGRRERHTAVLQGQPAGGIPKGVDARTPGLVNWSNNPDRRVLMTAVINCKAEGIKGNTSDVQVQKSMLMFLTDAVGYYVGGDDNDLLWK